MDITDKASHSTHEAYDKIADATSQVAEALGEKGDPQKKAEEQLMKKYLSYVRYNPWVTQ